MYGDNYDTEVSTSVRFTRYTAMFIILNGIIGLAGMVLFYPIQGMIVAIWTLGFLFYGGGFILFGFILYSVSTDDTLSIVFKIASLIASFISLTFWMQNLEPMAWSSFSMIVVLFGALCQRSYAWSESDYD